MLDFFVDFAIIIVLDMPYIDGILLKSLQPEVRLWMAVIVEG